ncbi:MAG: hypothetical protein FWE42_04590 [Defluviitaleaceae bacterium]|nr:hypothetical protein [Defluviitaleaceae bacterium]
MKKLIALATLVMLLLFVAACGGNNETTPAATPTPEPVADTGTDQATPQDTTTEDPAEEREWMEFSVMLWDAAVSFGDEPCEIYQYIMDRFQITFVPYNVGWDNAADLGHLWAAGGTLPDIIGVMAMPGTPAHFEWADVGLVRSIPDEMAAQFPYVQQILNQSFSQDFQINGRNYIIPRAGAGGAEFDVMARALINRRDWRESLGIPVPETPDDFLYMWRAFADPANDMNGDGSPVFGVLPDHPGALFQAFGQLGDTRTGWRMRPDGNMVIPMFEPTAIPMLSFLREAWHDNLIHPDFITQAAWVSIETFANGNAGTLIRQANPNHLERVRASLAALQPDLVFEEAIEIILPPQGPDTRFFQGSGFWSESRFNARLSDERLERILEVYDWLLSPDGMRMMIFGFEGIDWELAPDGEIIMLTDINPETGAPFNAFDQYQFARGGMINLASWPADYLMWVNPTVSREVREMSTNALNSVLHNPNSVFVTHDGRLAALNVEEANAMVLHEPSEWVAMISEVSNLSDEELFEQFYARWAANGYTAAKEAMTAAAAEAGITYTGPMN